MRADVVGEAELDEGLLERVVRRELRRIDESVARDVRREARPQRQNTLLPARDKWWYTEGVIVRS